MSHCSSVFGLHAEDSPLNIVVLDGYTLNPGDLSWKALEELGDCTVYDRTHPPDVITRAADCEIVLTNKTLLSKEIMEQLPQLKYIGVLATGYNVVDKVAARQRDIPVTNVPTYGTSSVAQMVFAHLLHFTQRVAAHAQSVADGKWTNNTEWCYWDYPLVELQNQTMGVVGFGRIGRATAHLALAFGMSVLAYDTISVTSPEGVQMVDLDTVFRDSDVVSLHCPLTPDTESLVNKERLAMMKSTALLINTSRGSLVDQQALADALNEGSIAGAGLDVLTVEPPPSDNPLIGAKNCQITPHIAWATLASRDRLIQIVADNVKTFMAGKPQNVIN